MHRGLTLYRLKLLRAFSFQCRDLSDSAYSCISAITFRKKFLLRLDWTRLIINLAANRTSTAAEFKFRSSSCRMCFASFKIGSQIHKQETVSKKRGDLFYLNKNVNMLFSLCKEVSLSRSSYSAALLFRCQSTLLLS